MPIKIGFADNPDCQTQEIFEDGFIVSLKHDTIKSAKDFNFDLIEMHMALLEEIPEDESKIRIFREYTVKLKQNNIYVMMHFPFTKKDMKYYWLVKPESFDNAVELSWDKITDILNFCSGLKIERLTIHAAMYKVKLNLTEFKLLKDKLLKIISYIKENNLGIKLSVETGGLTKQQLVNLSAIPELFITFDLTHYILDTNDSIEQAVEFFDKISDKVFQIHLSQSQEGRDMHQPLYSEGVIDNKTFIKHLKTVNHDLFILLETNADKENIDFIRALLP